MKEGALLRFVMAENNMRILEALAILEAAVLECKKRNVNTPEVSAALHLLEPYIWPTWVIPQFRYHIQNERETLENRERQQQVLRATFPGIYPRWGSGAYPRANGCSSAEVS